MSRKLGMNVFEEHPRELYARVYRALLGPIPDGVTLDADGYPSSGPGSTGAEYRNCAADLWRDLHATTIDELPMG